MDKVKEFIEQLRVSHDENFQQAGSNMEKVLLDKVCTYCTVLYFINYCTT